MSHPLDKVNLTELLQLGREGEVGNIGRQLPRSEIYKSLEEGEPEHDCPLEEKRVRMQRHIKKNYRRLRTQLPGCTGKCQTYGCPDLVVQKCWENAKGDML
jgi:hypothetical protein